MKLYFFFFFHMSDDFHDNSPQELLVYITFIGKESMLMKLPCSVCVCVCVCWSSIKLLNHQTVMKLGMHGSPLMVIPMLHFLNVCN
jgi:hypothetical protein